MRTTYHVTPCYFTDKSDFIVFKTGKGLTAFLENTDYDCEVSVRTDNSVVSFNEYGFYGDNNGPLS